ncbi:transient receptor potential cation channel subfamily M member 3-like isoform X2 [Biomphalaria glabrata]|nr:transient receptor potential cation channel subfamily M member 3 isoform X2 [Biomphalaria glabrata]
MPHRRSQERHANRKKRLSADLANIQYISSSCQHSPVYENSRIFTVGTRLSRSLPSSPIRSMSSPNVSFKLSIS